MTPDERSASPAGSAPRALPARDFQAIRLAESVERDRCPLCDVCQGAAADSLRSFAREGASDVAFRAELDRGVAFCQVHSRGLSRMELLQTSSQLATAVLLEAILRRRLATLRRLATADARAAQRGLGGLRQADCPVCLRAAEAESQASERLVGLAADPAWAEALAAAPLCLDHLVGLWQAAAASPDGARRFAPIVDGQLRRLEAERAELAGYAHNSTADRRQLITPAQRESAARALQLFGGEPERDFADLGR